VQRRAFIWSVTAAICGVRATAASPDRRRDDGSQTEQIEGWRTFEVTTHVHVQHASGVTRVWLPTPLAVAPYQKTLGDTYHVDDGTVSMVERDEIDLLAAEWPDGVEPLLTLTSRVSTNHYAIDFETPTVAPPRDFSAFGRHLRTLKGQPEDVKAIAAKITRGAGTDLDRARAIYDWILDPRNGDPEGTDRNAKYVGLARAAGLPARLVYGLRLTNDNATKAQHARAEVYLVGYGWVPIDGRDRQRFGSWEREWVAYNAAQDLVLPGSTHGPLSFFMHPQGETAGHRIDSLDATAFRYEITVRKPD